MKTCTNCKGTLPKNSTVCPHCGIAVNNKKRFPVIGLILAIILGAAIVIGTYTLSKGEGAYRPEYVVDKYIKAYYVDYDAERVFTLSHPDYVDAMCEEMDVDRSDRIDEMQVDLDELEEEMKDVDGSVKWKITDIDDVDKDEMDEIEEYYDECDIKVKDAKLVEVNVTAYEDGEKSDKITLEFYVIKADGKWYFDSYLKK